MCHLKLFKSNFNFKRNVLQDNLDDLSQIRKRRNSLPSLPKNTLFLYHDGAYSKPIEDALKEIDTWLGDFLSIVITFAEYIISIDLTTFAVTL